MEFVAINGARLAYRLEGLDNAPLFVTLHGGRGFGKYPASPKRM
jgi:proline iminopeptidase